MTMLPIADEVSAAARHGSYCPKMCTFACPVAAATGRDEAVPWSFHRVVSDLADGRRDPADVDGHLDLCNGCLACQSACTYEQDVPAQVVAARTALVEAGHVRKPAQKAADAAILGRSPFDVAPPEQPPSTPDAETVVVVGCRDTATSLHALATISMHAGAPVRFAQPEGCCGGVLRSLGMADMADVARKKFAERVVSAKQIVALDQTCLPVMPVAIHVMTWLYRLHGGGQLRLDGDIGPVTWHDPPSLVRRHGLDHAPRALLRAMGGQLVEPEGSGRHAVSAGPGLGMELLAPEVAAQVAQRRAAQLAATGAPVVTVGAPELAALRSAGLEVVDLLEVVAANLEA